MASTYLKGKLQLDLWKINPVAGQFGVKIICGIIMCTLTEETCANLPAGVEAGAGRPHSQEGLPPSQRDCAKASAVPRTCSCSQVLCPSQVNAAVLPRSAVHPQQGVNKNHSKAFPGVFPVPSKVFGETFSPLITK